MAYYKTTSTDNLYIIYISTGAGQTPITEAEYNAIMTVIRNRPTPPEGKDYRLRTDLTWEEYDLPPAPAPQPEDEITDGEALNIITEG